jgi:predicted tellurium resistance membrane protein TerC
MFDFLTPEALIALFTLTLLEIVLGIDNIIFIAILVAKLPAHLQNKARQIGLSLAMIMRVLLLLCITWIMGLTKPMFYVPLMTEPSHPAKHVAHEKHPEQPTAAATAPATAHAHHDHDHAHDSAADTPKPLAMTGQRLILLLGGLFLIAKSTYEIHDKLEGAEHEAGTKKPGSFAVAIVQILALDLVFSLDSVITAVGMAKDLWVMITAVIIAVGVMLIFSGYIVRFVQRHPTIKILALSFLILIGVMLVAEGLGRHIEKGYIYFAMAFAVAVEMINIRMRKAAPLPLHHSGPREDPAPNPHK